jgi:membrane protease YdiL (CAAX protease family)
MMDLQRSRRPEVRRLVVLVTPAAVPVSMAAAFTVLARRLPARTAYNVGFAIYWAGWCMALPVAVLGPRRAVRVLASGRRPSPGEAIAVLLPVLGAVSTELLPRRRLVEARVLAVMIGAAVVNATSEELLWRGMFLEVFPEDPIRGSLWPLAGFSLWHLAPQIVLPSRHGRAGFVVGAAVVGAASAFTSWRTRGLRWVLLPHIATDACGVVPARFRLGMAGTNDADG